METSSTIEKTKYGERKKSRDDLSVDLKEMREQAVWGISGRRILETEETFSADS